MTPRIHWLFTGSEFEWIPPGGTAVDPIPGRYVLKPNVWGMDPRYEGPPEGPLGYYDAWTSVGLPPAYSIVGVGAETDRVPNWTLYETMRDRGWRLGEISVPGGALRNVFEQRNGDWIAIGAPVIWQSNDLAFDVVFTLAAGYATAGMASAIGTAAIGAELAASYPALAQSIGTVAVNTAANGGDVKAAVERVAPSLVAGFVGAGAASQFDSVAAGRAVAAATATAIQGGDIGNAVAQSLVQTGLKSGADMLSTWNDEGIIADAASAVPIDPGYGYGVDAGVIPIADVSTDYFGSPVADTFPLPSVPDIPVYTDTPQIVIDERGFASSALDFLTDAALAAIKVNAAYQASQKPAPRITTANSGTVATAAGVLVTRDPVTGAVRDAGKPPAGTPYVLPDGRILINMGDGTYTLTSANGAVQRLPYSTGTGPGAIAGPSLPPWALTAALGVGAFLLLSRAR